MASVNPPEGTQIGHSKLHYTWVIVAIATLLQLSTNFVSQAFAVLLVVLQENFARSLTAITLAYFFRSMIGSVVYDTFGAYDMAWIISVAASLSGVVCIILLEPTSRVLIPDWEKSLPPEARTSTAPS